MALWITTHWPVPQEEVNFARHVYSKKLPKVPPQAGDEVLVRETQRPSRNLPKPVYRCHEGRSTPVEIPQGSGGIIGYMWVIGTRRKIRPSDLVYDYDRKLGEWMLIECRDFQRMELPLPDLLDALGKPGASARFLNLWCVPESLEERLRDRLSL